MQAGKVIRSVLRVFQDNYKAEFVHAMISFTNVIQTLMLSININRPIDRNVLHKAFNTVKLAVFIFCQVLNQLI